MKNFAAVTFTALVIASAASPARADEFGQRFEGQSPAALQSAPVQDLLADENTSPQNIEPAAGSEAPDAEKHEDKKQLPDAGNQQPVGAPPQSALQPSDEIE